MSASCAPAAHVRHQRVRHAPGMSTTVLSTETGLTQRKRNLVEPSGGGGGWGRGGEGGRGGEEGSKATFRPNVTEIVIYNFEFEPQT